MNEEVRMIYVIATLVAKPGTRDALTAGAKPCIEATRKEAGCISYDLCASATDPNLLVFVERWESREALTAHSKMPHLQAWRDISGPLLVSKKIEIVAPEKVETY